MRKLTQTEYENKVFESSKGNIKIIGEYVNRRTKIKAKCNICGYEWETNPDPLTRGHGCPKCANNIRRTTESFKKELFELVGNEYNLIGEYKGINNKITLIHNACGNIFEMRAKDFLINGQRCPKERYIKSSKSNSIPFEKIQSDVKKLGKGNYEIVGEYIRSSKKVEFLHKECGKIFKMEPTRFINGGIRCPHCYRSKGEEVIRDYLENNKFDFKEQYRIKDCRNIRPLPFDFAIFVKGKLNLLIEYDGSQHYGRKFNQDEESYLKLKTNDNIKTNFCKNNNIPLIRIKFIRSENPNIFKEKLIQKLKENLQLYNMSIPSQA